jgi:predicted DNA-binding transcriptional regulator AlpA
MIVAQDVDVGRVERQTQRATAQSFDPYGRFLKLADVMQSIGVSQAMVYKLMQDNCLPFPRPIKIGRASVWIERDVVAWKASIAGDSTASYPGSQLTESKLEGPKL